MLCARTALMATFNQLYKMMVDAVRTVPKLLRTQKLVEGPTNAVHD